MLFIYIYLVIKHTRNVFEEITSNNFTGNVKFELITYLSFSDKTKHGKIFA